MLVACKCPRGLAVLGDTGTSTGRSISGDNIRVESSARSSLNPGSFVSTMMPPLASLRSCCTNQNHTTRVELS